MSAAHSDFGPIAPITESEYDFICDLVYRQSRIKLGPNKRELVMARLSKRLRALGLKGYAEYCQYVRSKQGEEEISDLIDAMSTNHTFFFREISHFDFLKNTLLPALAPKESAHPQLRIWSAACSSGEEPYSLALLLASYYGAKSAHWTIDCTDISFKILKKAKEGVFASERLHEVPRAMVDRYFVKCPKAGPDHYQVVDEIKDHMKFQQLNLLGEHYPFRLPYDLIVCRNVMIYFDKTTQSELVNKFWPLLKPGGYLFIGHAESLTGTAHHYKMIKPAIYQRPL